MATWEDAEKAKPILEGKLPRTPRMGVNVVGTGECGFVLNVMVDAIDVPEGLPEEIDRVHVKYLAVGGFGIRDL